MSAGGAGKDVLKIRSPRIDRCPQTTNPRRPLLRAREPVEEAAGVSAGERIAEVLGLAELRVDLSNDLRNQDTAVEPLVGVMDVLRLGPACFTERARIVREQRRRFVQIVKGEPVGIGGQDARTIWVEPAEVEEPGGRQVALGEVPMPDVHFRVAEDPDTLEARRHEIEPPLVEVEAVSKGMTTVQVNPCLPPLEKSTGVYRRSYAEHACVKDAGLQDVELAGSPVRPEERLCEMGNERDRGLFDRHKEVGKIAEREHVDVDVERRLEAKTQHVFDRVGLHRDRCRPTAVAEQKVPDTRQAKSGTLHYLELLTKRIQPPRGVVGECEEDRQIRMLGPHGRRENPREGNVVA